MRIVKPASNWVELENAMEALLNNECSSIQLEQAFYIENFGSGDKVQEYLEGYTRTRKSMVEPDFTLDELEKAQEVLDNL